MLDDRFNQYYEALLTRYKNRNTRAVTRHLKSLCGFLRQEGNQAMQTMYGGPVRRRTYVNGLSEPECPSDSEPVFTGKSTSCRSHSIRAGHHKATASPEFRQPRPTLMFFQS